jgi:hypothetical protein
MSIHEDWKDPEAPKRGMSTTAKVLLILGCVGGVFALLCCGGGVFVYFRLKDALEKAVVLDPQLIREQADQIVKIDLPPGFEPKQAVNALVLRWVVYEKNPDDGSRLRLMGIDHAIVDAGNPETQKMQMMQVMQQQEGTPGGEPVFLARETEQREIRVRGEPAKFEFAKGTAAADGQEMRQVTGSFKTPTGIGLIVFLVPVEGYDEAAVVKMLESIADPQPAGAPGQGDDSADDAAASDRKTGGAKGEGCRVKGEGLALASHPDFFTVQDVGSSGAAERHHIQRHQPREQFEFDGVTSVVACFEPANGSAQFGGDSLNIVPQADFDLLVKPQRDGRNHHQRRGADCFQPDPEPRAHRVAVAQDECFGLTQVPESQSTLGRPRLSLGVFGDRGGRFLRHEDFRKF